MNKIVINYDIWSSVGGMKDHTSFRSGVPSLLTEGCLFGFWRLFSLFVVLFGPGGRFVVLPFNYLVKFVVFVPK